MGLRILVPKPRLQRSLLRANKFVWAALGVALWATAYTLFGASGFAGVLRAQAEIERLEERVVTAAEANRELERRIRDVKADPATIERLAREEFYLAKPGETVYLLPPATDPVPPEAETEPTAVPDSEQNRRP